MHVNLTICYPGRVTCSGCGRDCGISAPVWRVDDPHHPDDARMNGWYCRRCSARVLDHLHVCFGMDAELRVQTEWDAGILDGIAERCDCGRAES